MEDPQLTNLNKGLRGALLAGTIISGIAFAAPAMAQSAPQQPETVVVTGSILKRKNLNSQVPLTVISSADIEKRGVTTIETVGQNLSGNNGGAMTNNWSANGNFAAGASAVSLRGLTTNSTLVLFDGMRAAYYPLADDATRNFVDLNTIPNVITDRVEVLQDGASSSYGADAIAGVVNVITRKQFKGFIGKVYGGSSEAGGADNFGASALWGKGDLASDGYNIYLGGEYQQTDMLAFNERGFPYNTADQSSDCTTSILGNTGNGIVNGKTCRANGIQNGLQFNGTFAGVGNTVVAHVRPYTPAGAAVGNWQMINTTLGCGRLNPITFTGPVVTNGGAAVAGIGAGTTLCQQDLVKDYNKILPENTRKSVSFRVTKDFSEDSQLYAMINLYQNESYRTSAPRGFRDSATPGAAGSNYSTAANSADFPTIPGGLFLPVYICNKNTIGACNAGNGTLNPNNPFAAAGNVARLVGRPDREQVTTTDSLTSRFALGWSSKAFGWDYNADFVAMRSNLTYVQDGRIYIKHLIDVIKDGSFNFMNQSLNSEATWNYLMPRINQKSVSDVVEGRLYAARDLMELAGGPLQLGLGVDARWEYIDNPSANPDPVGGDPRERYFGTNPFGATGGRSVYGAFFELNAPVATTANINLSGRYDKYSTGFDAFSPKVSASWKVIPSLTLRGSYSQGFRAPAIAETNSDPSTGFITLSAPAAFQALHGNNGYGAPYSVGLTTVAAKNLKPELSESLTVGAVWQPTSNIGFTLDYYNIHKEDIIQGGDYAPALAAYFAGQPIPAGFAVIPGTVDALNPTLLATPGFVQYGLINLSSQDNSGYDMAVTARHNLGPVKWTTSAEATYIEEFSQTYPDGTVQRYDGTLGNNQITSGSGTPKWKGNWQNTFDFGKFSTTLTAFYTDGYTSIAADNGDAYTLGDCSTSATVNHYQDGATEVQCEIDSFVFVDAHAQYKINDNYMVYLDVGNLFDQAAPKDPNSTYGITQYNVAFHGAGVIGRTFRLGAKVTF